MQTRLATLLTWVMEALVAFLAMFAAWPFGSVHAYFQWILLTGVAILLACWGGRAILLGRPIWTRCPIALGIAAMCLLAILQILPLSESWSELLSPETTALQRALVPASGEGPFHDEQKDFIADHTISMAPTATRRNLVQLIAVLAVFCVVRSNLHEPAAFHRLAWLSAGNGVLLTIVGLGQMASSAPNTVFWSIPTNGQVFSTFICRNHFAFYINVCIGLTVGLLLGIRCFLPQALTGRQTRFFPWRDLLRDQHALWLVSALGIMLAGLLFSLSRGGVFGLLAGGFLGLLTLRRRGITRWRGAGLVLALTGILVFWLGFDRVSQRWEKLWEDNIHAEARATVWKRVLPLTARFPVWGSGLGTFSFVEPATRVPGDPFDILHDHAHNDYLELWVEGGPFQLALAFLIVGIILTKGIQAIIQHGPTANGRLAVGAVIGFAAVALHSLVDFGLHVPAVSLLAAVLAAFLANLADFAVPRNVEARPATASRASSRAFVQGTAAVLQAGALAATGVLLINQGRSEEQAERFRLAGIRAPEARRVNYLRSALVFASDRPDIHLALADALIKRWHDNREWQQLMCVPTFLATAPCPNLAAFAVLAQPAPRGWTMEADLREAWQHILRARRLSPLDLNALEKQSRLAGVFGVHKTKHKALSLLRQLSPSDPVPWLWAGHEALERHDKETACRYWRNALLRTDRYLPEIVQAVPGQLAPDELLECVLPANAALIVKALDEINKRTAGLADENHYLGKALATWAARSDRLDADSYLLKARIHARLDQVNDARSAYESALSKQSNVAWRFEFCDYLSRLGLYQQARHELVLLLAQDPHNQRAHALRQHVLLKIAEKPVSRTPRKADPL